MERELFVSTGRGIGACAWTGKILRHTAIEGAGAICAAKDSLLCAGENGRTLFRLDKRTLMPQALYPGGPGLCEIRLSPDEERLYALCAEADSVMMLDAHDGRPQIVCRTGCYPRGMALEGGVLAIAGGESGCVHLVSAYTLEAMESLSAPGPVYGTALCGGRVYALCLTQTLDSLLMTAQPGGQRQMLALSGMPGSLLVYADMLLAATQCRLYAVSADGARVLHQQDAPGRLHRMTAQDGALYAVDLLGERLYTCAGRGGRWRALLADVRDMA